MWRLPEEHGGADGTVADLCAMVDEAAAALVPGPVATTALATLVLDGPHAELLEALASGRAHRRGRADEPSCPTHDGRVSGSAPYVLGAGDDTRRGAAAARGRALAARRRRRRRRDGRTAEGHRFLPPAGAGGARRRRPPRNCRCPRSASSIWRRRCWPPKRPGWPAGCCETATEYAKVREQFGKPIGSFQAIKHMCAEMLLRSEQASVAAADAARAASDADDDQLSIAAALAASVGIEAAKANAKDCIQVLGGIGITWEHDAHLYLRRAYGIAQFLGGRSRWLRRVAALTQQGVRRDLHIDLASVADLRPEIASAVAEVAASPAEKRQVALAETGLLAPHWPRPYGRAAGPAEQLLIDQELAAADIVRPDLVIGWWAVPTILEHGSPRADRAVRARRRCGAS